MRMTRVKNKVELGKYLIEVSMDPAKLKDLQDNWQERLSPYVEIPPNHEVQVFGNSDAISHLVVPNGTFVSEMLNEIVSDGYGYPPEYNSNSEFFIDPKTTPLKAYRFRVGDYTLAHCG